MVACPAAFAVPAPGEFGNLERGVIRGPGFVQTDLTISKRFPMGESMGIEFRTEIFNVFNRSNYANPNGRLPNVLGTGEAELQPGEAYTSAAAGSFGKLTSTVERTVGIGTNRQIQFGLRLDF